MVGVAVAVGVDDLVGGLAVDADLDVVAEAIAIKSEPVQLTPRPASDTRIVSG